MSFEHTLDLNRPAQPHLSDLPLNREYRASEAEVGQWGVTDG